MSTMKNRKWLVIVSGFYIFASLACRIFPQPALPATEIPVSTEAAGSLEQEVEEAIQQAESTGVFELSLTEEQVTSYVAIKLQETEGYVISSPQLFLRDGKVKGFAEIDQNSLSLPLEFEVKPSIVANNVPELSVDSVKIAGVAAPDVLITSIQQVIDQAYAEMILDVSANFIATRITIADGVMTIVGQMK